MLTAAELAGFFAAHAIWCVSDGNTLVPILAYTTENNERKMERMVCEDLATAVAWGKQKLETNTMNANDAVLLSDGRISLGEEKSDAIIIEVRAYFSPDSEMVLGVPYTPITSGRFLVHKPKLLLWKNCDDFDLEGVLVSFFEGVDSHKEGSKIWKERLDESK